MYLGKCCRDGSAPGLLPLAVWTHWSPLSCLQLRAAEPALSSCSSRQMEPLCPRAPPAHLRTRSRWTAEGHRLSTSPIASLSFSQNALSSVCLECRTLVETKLGCNNRLPYTQMLISPPSPSYFAILNWREKERRGIARLHRAAHSEWTESSPAAASHWHMNGFSHTNLTTKSTCSEHRHTRFVGCFEDCQTNLDLVLIS